MVFGIVDCCLFCVLLVFFVGMCFCLKCSSLFLRLFVCCLVYNVSFYGFVVFVCLSLLIVFVFVLRVCGLV